MVVFMLNHMAASGRRKDDVRTGPDYLKKRRDIITGHFFCPLEISIAKHGNAAASLRREDDFQTICLKDLNRSFSDINLVGICITSVKIGNLSSAFGMVPFKPLSESGGF